MSKYSLVTGGAGYIGSHTVKHLLKNGLEVIVLDNLSHGFKDALKVVSRYGKMVFVKCDLRNEKALEKVFNSYPISEVVHCAALCSVDESMRDPEAYFDTNVRGSINLIKQMLQHNVERLILSSTCAVYGEAQYLPIDEQHPTLPINPYGESKLMVENIISDAAKACKLRYIIMRYFNVCGADESGELGDSRKPSVLLVQNAVRGALHIDSFKYTNKKVKTKDGTTIRDYLDVRDVADAHLKAIRYLRKEGVSAKINLGTGQGYSVKEILEKVEQVVGVTIAKENAKVKRGGEYAALYASNEEAKKILVWEPQRTLEESIKSLVCWYSRHPYGFLK